MSWAANARKFLIAAIAFALIVASIAIASWAGTDSTTGPVPFAPVFSVGAPPIDTDGTLKIVKNLGGGWPDGAFIFHWECDDNDTTKGSATFPDDFTGANYTVTPDIPVGTNCWVEETDGTLSVSDYLVTTHIESAAGFQAINGRNVPIDNSKGLNTIQFMNELCDPYLSSCRPG